MATVYINTEVEVDLAHVDVDTLIEEIERHGYKVIEEDETILGEDLELELITKVYEKRRIGQDYQKELDDMIYYFLGRII